MPGRVVSGLVASVDDVAEVTRLFFFHASAPRGMMTFVARLKDLLRPVLAGLSMTACRPVGATMPEEVAPPATFGPELESSENTLQIDERDVLRFSDCELRFGGLSLTEYRCGDHVLSFSEPRGDLTPLRATTNACSDEVLRIYAEAGGIRGGVVSGMVAERGERVAVCHFQTGERMRTGAVKLTKFGVALCVPAPGVDSMERDAELDLCLPLIDEAVQTRGAELPE
jgi:hypothetical protein